MKKEDIITCPKCGSKIKRAKFCSNCGTRLTQKLKETKSSKNINMITFSSKKIFTIILVIVLVIVIATVGYLANVGYFKSPTQLFSTVKIPPNACGGEITYSVELKNSNNEALSGGAVYTYANDALLEKLITDQNGRVSSTKNIPSEWCGKQINFTLSYPGDILHENSSNTFLLTILIPTELQIIVPNEAIRNELTNVTVTLRNAIYGSPIGYKKIIISNGASGNITTDATGYGETQIIFTDIGTKKIRAKFDGDKSYGASESQVVDVTVKPQTCIDGTIVNHCSEQTVGYYCEENKTLIFDCLLCGCPQGLVCYNNNCITQEEETALLVADLQKSIVYVEHSYGTGSGIIIKQSNGQTIILTNEHVVEGASSISDITITTFDKKTAHADKIKIAPNGMDLAVIYISGNYGEVAHINYSEQYQQGQGVLALGSPLGLQGSVSEGIISNFIDYTTETGYYYTAIQTDAAINLGNSGGGLFLRSTGTLVGVNSFKFIETEGLNFAIEFKELQRLSNYDSWQQFSPIPKCLDGTPYNTCSDSNIGYYCSNGYLSPMCSLCGCSYYYPNCATEGPDRGSCFSCPPGHTAYPDATCCAPGYYWVEYGGCCPYGTYYGGDGYCYWY